MKNHFRLAMLSATALMSAVMLSGCSSSSEEVVDNPNYDPVNKTVKATLSLNIDPDNSATTRQPYEITQASGSFRGMMNLYLYSAASPISGSTSLTGCMQLDGISSDELSESQSSKVYTNRDVAVGTSNFLFIGKAFATTSADKLKNGFTEANISASASNPSQITISPVSILQKPGGTMPKEWALPALALETYVDGIATAPGWSTATNPQLQNAYASYHSGDNHAGSASAVLATAQALYDFVYPLSATDDVAKNIIAAITTDKYISTSGSGSSLTMSWKSGTDIDASFPANVNLPDGAAQYRWNKATQSIEYLTAPVLDASTGATVEKFIYPNELYYLTSTSLKATSSDAIWPNTVAEWRSTTWSGWSDVVSTDTRNIALVNNIQYGTAMLATQVRCVPDNNVLYDNAIGVQGAAKNNAIPYKDGAFPLTGVIVGCQPSQVGWDFLPTASATFDRNLYDGNMTNNIAADNKPEYSYPNYTLVFDNYVAGEEQKNVNICLEFLNNSGYDFYGKNGIVLKGQKFYLIATLDVDGSEGSLDFSEEDTFFPSTVKRIFVQDFVTTAKLTLTAGSVDGSKPGGLSDAEVTVPDLVISTQALGLSVDLKWKPGLSFTVHI